MITIMKKIALTIIGCITILAACSNSEDVAVQPSITTEGDVALYVTTAFRTKDLSREAVSFSQKDNMAPTTIQIDPSVRYQEMDGFGAAITGSTCYNLMQMKPEDKRGR